jgi:hypothetical protein
VPDLIAFVLTGGVFMVIQCIVKIAPSRQLMLVPGATLFVSARLTGIFVALDVVR